MSSNGQNGCATGFRSISLTYGSTSMWWQSSVPYTTAASGSSCSIMKTVSYRISIRGFLSCLIPLRKQGVSLNTAGIRLQTGKGTAIGMGKGGISLTSRGDAALTGKNGIEVDMLSGKQVTLKAEEYIFIQCGMSAAALLPEEIHLKGTRVQMDSPLNGKGETVFSDEAIETLKEMYYNEKWGSPLQLFMPDGTVIGRVKGLEGNAALRKYFEENVLGTGEYVNYLDSETLAPYYEDGTLDPAERENYENSLYLKWLSATYGKTRLEKAGDWLMTKEGRHAALDGIGIFLDPADLVNAVLYLSEGELGDAALSGVSMIPMLGDLFGKGRKGTKYLLKAADLTKLNRNRKVVKVLENIDIFIKARKADMGELQKWIRKSLDNLAHGGDEVIELVTPDGIKIRISGDLRANINLMDETGDILQDTVRLGEKAGDGGEALKEINGALESGLNSNLLDELANSGVKYNPEDIVAITKTADGKLVWLENGTDAAGLNHIIIEHAGDFLNKGITQEQIPDYIMNALENGKIIGYQGRGTGRPIYEFIYNGENHKVAITVGNNGFIVGANPK